MARTIENECVGCPPEMGCLGSACPKRNVHRYYCDKCGQEYESNELYVVDGEDICSDCILDEYQTVQDVEDN